MKLRKAPRSPNMRVQQTKCRTRRRRIGGGVAAAAVVSVLVMLGGASPATALGYAPIVNCIGGGNLNGRSYQFTFSDAGGWTSAELDCSNKTAAIQLRYQAYPGSPTYTTSQSFGTGYVSKTQSGTVGGIHRALNQFGTVLATTNS